MANSVKDVLTLIQEAQVKFSKGQRRIAKYIAENYDKAAFMTAGKLGKTVGVSESTVVRFAAELGYDGYPGMRKALQEMVRSRLTSLQRIEVARDNMGNKDILTAVLNADIDKIRMTLEDVDKGEFDRAVNAILGAKRIYILGMRSSLALANFMGFYFNLLFENVEIVSNNSVSEVFEKIFRIQKGDVMIGISFPRYSSRAVKAMAFAHDMGATVIGLTDGALSPVSQISDIKLYARSDMVSFLDSLVAPLSLINALTVAVGAKINEELAQTFEKLESIWAEYQVYEKVEN